MKLPAAHSCIWQRALPLSALPRGRCASLSALCGVSPSFDPVAFVALPPPAVAFSINQYQPNF
jgi:hypothetical protein